MSISLILAFNMGFRSTQCLSQKAGFHRRPYLLLHFWRAVSTDETSYEAGIKVQIHSQDEPPFIDQLGFGVAPGFQTFVSCQQQLVPNIQPPPLQPRPFSLRFILCLSPNLCHCPLALCQRPWGKIRSLIQLLRERCSLGLIQTPSYSGYMKQRNYSSQEKLKELGQ